jgi:predicted dehydrogenase
MTRASKARGRRSVGGRVRYAVIGQGHFAQASILPAFANARSCELRAIFSQDETKLRALKRKYGVEAALDYEHYDEYLSSGAVDAVYVALPNDMHVDYVVRAARAGVHVLCEKPLAPNARVAEAMVSACREAGVRLMVAYRLHFDPAHLAALEVIQSGVLGDPRFFSSTFAMQIEEENIRTSRERGGGPLLDIGIYCVNAARMFFAAEPLDAAAIAATKAGDERFAEIDEQLSVVLRFPDERLAQFTCSFGAHAHSELTVVGERGRLRLAPAYNLTETFVLETETEGGRTRRRSFAPHDQVAPELEELARCIREGRDPEPSGEEGVADLRVTDAIQRAADSGDREHIEAVERARRPSPDQKRRVPLRAKPKLVNVAPSHKN